MDSLRNNEDFKALLASLHSDFGGKLELRVTEVVNRILNEQEDRMR
jgi:hypothetical protein